MNVKEKEERDHAFTKSEKNVIMLVMALFALIIVCCCAKEVGLLAQ